MINSSIVLLFTLLLSSGTFAQSERSYQTEHLNWIQQKLNIDSFDEQQRLKFESNIIEELQEFSLDNKFDIYYYLSREYRNENTFKALKYITKAISFTKEIAIRRAVGYSLKGDIEHQLGNYSEANRCFHLAQDYFNSLDDMYAASFMYGPMGNNYVTQDSLDKALQCYKKLKLSMTSLGVNNGIIQTTDGNIGALYLLQEQPDSAFLYIRIGNSSLRNHIDSMNYYGNMAFCYYLFGNYSASESYYDTSFFLVREDESKEILLNLYKDRYQLFKKQKRYHEALSDYEHFQLIEDEMNKDALLLQSTRWSAQTRLTEKQNQIEKAKIEKDNLNLKNLNSRNRSTFLWVISLFILLLIGSIIFFRLLGRKRENALLKLELHHQEKQTIIRNQQKEINELELFQLKIKYDNRKNDLVNFSIELQRKEELSSNIINLLKTLKITTESDTKIRVQELISFVKLNLSVENDVQNFMNQVDQINSEYIAKLTLRYKGMTKSDVQLSCFLRIGMTTKDIATIKNISPRSIEMSRYRLRKKIGLDSGVDLSSFFKEF